MNHVIERIEGRVMPVNSYIVHGPTGVVVVDGQLTVSDAALVRAAVDATGKELAAVLLTHPHPDHYAGAGLVARGAPILATPAVDAVIRRDDALKHEIVGPMMGEQWPQERRFPNQLVAPGTTVELAGLAFRVTEIGPGESHADTLWWLDERTVFSGDVASNHTHAYLADAQHRSWLDALVQLEEELPNDVVLHLGHGEPAGKEALGAQRRYIERFLTAVEACADREPEARRLEVVERMRAAADDERLLFLMELSVDPVHESLVEGAR